MSDTEREGIRHVPASQQRVYSVKRGGRFGITVESRMERPTWKESAGFFVVSLAVVAAGYYSIPGGVGIVAMILGAFIAGVSLERITWMRAGDVVKEGDE